MRNLRTFIALNRFGLGARPGDDARVGDDPRGWLEDQIGPENQVPGLLRAFPPTEQTLHQLRLARLESQAAGNVALRDAYQSVFYPQVMAGVNLCVTTQTPLRERLVAFWANHFTTSTTKRGIGPAIPGYVQEAIRPHVFGRFVDMLLAVASHPVMLAYLDNTASVGPNSRVGRRRIAEGQNATTLNENFARELLELHTLGVGGGYEQNDVIELALALTGWNYGGTLGGRDPSRAHGHFDFREVTHEPGARVVLGRQYPDGGVEQARAILIDLARHPATAWHIATKLVRHFVSDTPPPADIEAVAMVFAETGGDLAAVTRAVIALDSAWADPLAKVKSHHEYLVALYRALGVDTVRRQHFVAPLRLLGQIPYSAPSPQGWEDTASHWITPEALMVRIEWTLERMRNIDNTPDPRLLIDDVIGPVASQETHDAVTQAPAEPEGLALLFTSAEFQRR